jgi:hypothetical protein
MALRGIEYGRTGAPWTDHRVRGRLLVSPAQRIDISPAVLQKSQMDRYRFDDLIEYALTRQGRENLALISLAVGCVAGIVLIGRS